MEKPTELLLQQLADRLGTTTEYLWAALVRQAPITAAWNTDHPTAWNAMVDSVAPYLEEDES